MQCPLGYIQAVWHVPVITPDSVGFSFLFFSFLFFSSPPLPFSMQCCMYTEQQYGIQYIGVHIYRVL